MIKKKVLVPFSMGCFGSQSVFIDLDCAEDGTPLDSDANRERVAEAAKLVVRKEENQAAAVQEQPTNAEYVEAAREKLIFSYNVDRDEVDDGDATGVSRGDDGAWVPMWIWVRRPTEEKEG